MTKEKLQIEALWRIKEMDFHPSVANDFENDGTIYYSERTPLGGILYWLRNNPKWEEIVRKAEEKYGFLVYHCTHEYLTFGECLTMLYVSDSEEEWEMDRDDMRKVNGKRYFCAYVCNLTNPDFSSIGGVEMEEIGGGLVRVA